MSIHPGIISNHVPRASTLRAHGPASSNSSCPECIRKGLVKSTRATHVIPFISGELEAFTTIGWMRVRVEEVTETVPVPPTPSSWPLEAPTHCHHPGMKSLSPPPPRLHTRTSLQLLVPYHEKGDPRKYSSGCLMCSDAEKNAGEMQSLQWTRQSPPSSTGPPPNNRGKCSFISPCTTPHTSPAQKGRGEAHGSVSGELCPIS